VPGERVFVRAEGGWGRYLPTVDDLLALPLIGDRPVRLYSAFGATTITPPANPIRRLLNRARLAWRYAELAQLRLDCLAADEPRERRRFIERVHALFGIRIAFAPFADDMPQPPRLATLFAEARDAAGSPRGRLPAVGAAAGAMAIDFDALFDAVNDLLADSTGYLLSWAEGTQGALALFLAGVVTLFIARARLRLWRISRARRHIPLTIGGWGTRGKSGTERLKAGLLHGLGYDVVVKTTGCEAMLMHSVPGRLPLEIFIYRPYDKATIWEQRDTLQLASALDAEVFLWECMALNPRYVALLQHEWMTDDLVTLTNAYPDHEDVQGPAGEDVARVIGEFIPRNARLITSEVNFLPLFEQICRQRGTRMVASSPLDAELLADDLLALFPYQEHPRNIALVSTLAKELRVDPMLAIHTMAANVVPDLGVLQTYPAVRLRGRVLEFVNGMSANERAGFLNNWHRVGLEDVSLVETPGRAVLTVVNNRADRVPRSEIFARILVEDVAADAHVLIGTNLGGLQGYIRTALDAALAERRILSPADRAPGGDPQQPRRRLATEMTRLRIPAPTFESLSARLRIYLGGLERSVSEGDLATVAGPASRWLSGRIDALPFETLVSRIAADTPWRLALDHLLHVATPRAEESPPEVLGPAEEATFRDAADRLLARLALHARLQRQVEAAMAGELPVDRCNAEFHNTFRALFLARLVVVDDAGATGDQIIDACARALPPGVRATVMGIQNIKGTGLDFIYRWVALDKVVGLLRQLDAPAQHTRVEALRALAGTTDLGLVASGTARARLVAHGKRNLDAEERGALDHARRQIEERHRHAADGLGRQAERSALSRLADFVEDAVDFIDVLRRTRRARQVMDDLVHERISHDRAAIEMRAINARGKGGWLAKKLRA
ncbi:MAG: capsule biosynthesis protein CapB, partial [Myxococcales bacterium]|nr:capsule biosynthesis protein CapB [Myxococcales bacterium]